MTVPTNPLRMTLGAALLMTLLALPGCEINFGGTQIITPGAGKFHAKKVENLTRAIQETSVDVATTNGDVEVRQVEEAKEVTITIAIKAGGTTQEISDQRLSRVKTIAEEKNGTLTLRAEFPEPTYSTDAAVFKVEVPKLRNVDARTSNGEVVIHAASGDTAVSTANGGIQITSNKGTVDGTSSNGAILITDAASSVRAKTVNGSIRITMDATAAGPIDAESVNGSVKAEVGTAFGGTIEMSTTNGRIDFRDTNERAKKSTIRKHSGSVVLEGVGESTLETVNGSVTIVIR